MENKAEFLKELHDLLEKYSIEISIYLDGDTHGVSACLEIEHRNHDNGDRYESVLSIDELSSYDLKPYLK